MGGQQLTLNSVPGSHGSELVSGVMRGCGVLNAEKINRDRKMTEVVISNDAAPSRDSRYVARVRIRYRRKKVRSTN